MATHETSASAQHIFIRNKFISNRIQKTIEWEKGFPSLPLEEHDILTSSHTTFENAQMRLQQSAYALVLNKKLKSNTDSAIYDRIIQLYQKLEKQQQQQQQQQHHSKVSMLITTEIINEISILEKQVYSVMMNRSKMHFFDHNNEFIPSISSDPKYQFSLDMKIKVEHNIVFSAKEQMDPTIHVFFSSHVIPSPRSRYVQSFSGHRGGFSDIQFRDVPCFPEIDGQYAVVRFAMHSSFFPKLESSETLIYKRKRPFYQGFMYFSLIEKGKTYKIEMKDASLALINDRLTREDVPHVTLTIKIEDFEMLESVKFSRIYSEQLRSHDIDTMQKVIKRYYHYVEKSEPVFDSIRSMHVPKMPCNMYDILLPGAMFLLDLPENRPPKVLFDFALEIHNMSRIEFIQIAKQQFLDKTSTRVNPQFNRILTVAWRTLCTFSYMCEYSADVRFLVKAKILEDVERFIDVFYTRSGDCEDLAKAIIILFLSWCEYHIEKGGGGDEDEDEDNEALSYLIQTFRLFVCTSMKGSAYKPSASSRSIQGGSVTENDIVCHFWASCIPWRIYSKWTNTPYTPNYPWEASLFVWILEGTNDSHPSLRPLYELCEEEKRDQVRQELDRITNLRIKIEKDYKSLSNFSLYGTTQIKQHGNPQESDFYHYALEIWNPYESFIVGKNVSTFELYMDDSDKYGVSIHSIIYEPERIRAVPTFNYSQAEMNICFETLKQQWPIVLPVYPEKSKNEPSSQQQQKQKFQVSDSEEPLFKSLNELSRLYPVPDSDEIIKKSSGYYPPYIRYYVRNIFGITGQMYIDLTTILSHRYLGIYGFEYRRFKLDVGIDSHTKYKQQQHGGGDNNNNNNNNGDDCAELIELRIFFSS